MKRLTAILAFMALLMPLTSSAQKYCWIDTEYILENIPEYKAAQQQLDQLSISWQKDIEEKYAHIDKLYKDFQADQILLTEDMKRKRESEIIEKEKEVKEFQKQKFGYEGEIFKKKQELVKPLQDKIYNAIKKMAVDRSYAVVFDKSSDLIMLYSNPRYDKSDYILEQLGYTVNKNEGGSSSGSKSGTSSPRNAPAPSGGQPSPGSQESDIKPR
jgi:outer membrane protein